MVHPRGRALAVDDSSAGLKLLQALLASSGFEVRGARDARSALALHRAQPFDLLVTDWIMPGMDGLELLQELRRAGDETPVMVISGYRDERARELCERTGKAVWLEKPFDLDPFRAALDALLQPQAQPRNRFA